MQVLIIPYLLISLICFLAFSFDESDAGKGFGVSLVWPLLLLIIGVKSSWRLIVQAIKD